MSKQTYVLTEGKVPTEKVQQWKNKHYLSIKQLGVLKETINGYDSTTAMHKAFWDTIFNLAHTVVYYGGETTKERIQVIQSIIQNNVHCAYEDHVNKIKRVFTACQSWEEAKEATQELWSMVNDDIFDRKEENRILAIYNAARELLEHPDVYGKMYAIDDQPVTLSSHPKALTKVVAKENGQWIDKGYNILRYPDLVDAMIAELRIWARPFGIDIKLDSSETTCTTYQDLKHIISRKPGYKAEDSTTLWDHPERLEKAKITMARNLRHGKDGKSGSLRSNLLELLQAHMQVQWYIDNDPAQWLTPDYIICESCGKPVHKEWPQCEYCQTIAEEYVDCVTINRINSSEPVKTWSKTMSSVLINSIEVSEK